MSSLATKRLIPIITKKVVPAGIFIIHFLLVVVVSFIKLSYIRIVNDLKLILILCLLWFLLPKKQQVEPPSDNDSYEWSINPALSCFTRDGKVIEVEYQMVGILLKDPEFPFEEFVCNYVGTHLSTELRFYTTANVLGRYYPNYKLINITVVK